MKDGINPPLFRIREDLTNDLNRHVVTSILTRNMAPLPLFLFCTSLISRAAINNAQNRLRSETPRIMRSISFDRDLLAWINLHVETDHRFRDWSHFIEVFMREYRERIEKERLNEMGPYERRNHSEPLPSFDYDDRSGLDHIVILSTSLWRISGTHFFILTIRGSPIILLDHSIRLFRLPSIFPQSRKDMVLKFIITILSLPFWPPVTEEDWIRCAVALSPDSSNASSEIYISISRAKMEK